MLIGIDASKLSEKQKTGVGMTAYQIIFNLQKIDKKNSYLLYTNKSLSEDLITNPNFKEKNIPLRRLWHRFRLPLAILRDKPKKFLELTNFLPSTAPKKSAILIHDLAFKFFPEAYSKKELFLQEEALKRSIGKAKKIVLTSKTNANDLKKFYKIKNNRIEIIPLGINEEFFKKNLSKSNFINFSSPYFLYIGRIEKKKNVSNILKAFFQFKEQNKSKHKLLIIGNKCQGYKDFVRVLNSNKKYKNDVILKGYANNDDLIFAYKKAQAFIFPSLYEGFGLPILEAFACNTPVVTSKIPTIIETAGKAALLIDPQNINEIGKSLSEVAFNKTLRKNLIKKGKAQVKKFSWRKTAEKYYDLLNKL